MRRIIKPLIQSLKPKYKINHFSSQIPRLDDVGRPMASLLKTRTVIRFRGPDTIKFLQGLLTNDVRRFGDENLTSRSIYAAMLTAQGRYLFDIFLYWAPRTNDPDELVLLADVDSSVLDELLHNLNKYRLRSKVDIENVGEEFSCWQHFGSIEHTQNSCSPENKIAWRWHKDPRLDCLGFRGIFPSNITPPMVDANSVTEERNFLLWRLEKGVAEGSIEIPKGEAIPLEYNFTVLNAISFDKGCYVGQELIARSHHLGVIRKRLLPLKFLSESGTEVEQKVAPKSEVISSKSGKKAGTVTVALGPRGLGLLRLEEAFNGSGNLVIKGQEDVKVEPIRPEWWPTEW